MRLVSIGTTALAACFLLSGAALAQSSMPPPPSASDPLPRTTSEPARQRASRPAAARPAQPAPAVRSRASAATASEPSLNERIDTRPARSGGSGGLQLEDDPRAVRPVMQNGRAGVGMRF